MKKLLFFLFAFLIFFVPLVLWPFTSEVFEFNKMVLVYLLTTLIVAVWLTRSVLLRKIVFRHTILDIPLLIFLGSQLISTIISIDPQTSFLGYYSRFNGGLLSTICYSLLYWAFVSNFERKDAIRLINYSLLPSAVFVSIYGVLEHFGIDKNVWVQDVQSRVFSTLGQPNWLAAWLVALVPITWSGILNTKSDFKNSKLWIYLGLSILFSWTLIFTKSRSGLLGFLVAVVIFGIFTIWENLKGVKKIIAPSLIIGVSLFTICLISGTQFTPSLGQYFSGDKALPAAVSTEAGPALETGGTESGVIRAIVWKGAFGVWQHYPVFGTGVETFAYSYPMFRPVKHNLVSEWDFIYNKAHNEYLNLAANTGTFGLVSYLIFVGFAIYILIKSKNFALLAGFVSLLVTNFFGFSVVPTQLELFLFPAIAILIKND